MINKIIKGRKMKPLKTILFAIIIIFLIIQVSDADFKKTKIAVLDFQIQGEKLETADMGKIVAEWLITSLVKEGRFDVIERRLLEKILQEQQIGTSGLIDTQSTSKLGKILGVKIIVTGTVTKLGGFTEVNARVINVETGSIITAEKVKAESTIKLDILVSQLGDLIVRAFPLEGYVVNREGVNVTIDVGSIAGAKTGIKFLAYKEGKAIRHPKTGEVLDVETIATGEIEIKEAKEKTSIGVIIKESEPDAVSYGNMVRSVVALEKRPPEKPIKETPMVNVDYSLVFEDVEKNLDLSLNSKYKVKEYWRKIKGGTVNWNGEVVEIKSGRGKYTILVKAGAKALSRGYNVILISTNPAASNINKGNLIEFTGRLVDYGGRGTQMIFKLIDVTIK